MYKLHRVFEKYWSAALTSWMRRTYLFPMLAASTSRCDAMLMNAWYCSSKSQSSSSRYCKLVAVPFKMLLAYVFKSTQRLSLVYEYVVSLNLIRHYLKRYYKKTSIRITLRVIRYRSRMPFLPLELSKRVNRQTDVEPVLEIDDWKLKIRIWSIK